MVSDLLGLRLTSLVIRKEFDTTGCEFYVSLGKKINDAMELDRLATLQLIKDNNIADINQALLDKDIQLDKLNQALHNNNEQMAKLIEKVALLDTMLTSTSWRVTAPLRRIKSLISFKK